MRVLFVASECAPVVKVGGLADVVGGLPKALVKMGVEVSIALPFYESIKVLKYPASVRLSRTSADKSAGKQRIKELRIKYNNIEEKVEIFQTTLPETDIAVYLFKNNKYLSTGPIYNAKSAEGSDLDFDRFSFFSKAVVEFINLKFKIYNLKFDVIHCHDWHTAWIPTLIKNLKLKIKNSPKTLLTIHNMGRLYQGIADDKIVDRLGLKIDDRSLKVEKNLSSSIHPQNLTSTLQHQSSDTTNILLQGIHYADFLNTVSPTYAKEIQTPEFGEGLEDILRQRKDHLVGILNGIDYEVWNPETDKYLTANYTFSSLSLRGATPLSGGSDVAIYQTIDSRVPLRGTRNDKMVNWPEGKARNKIKLLETIGLPKTQNVPLFGMVSRIAEQKGFDILLPALETLLSSQNVRVIILGTGDPGLEDRIQKIEGRFKDKFKFITRFDEALAHQIYAGSDFFLMPSRFEPSGLGQLIAMRYGTLPIVRKVGGLTDSVNDNVTGFVFEEYMSDALLKKIEEGISNFQFFPRSGIWLRATNTNFQKMVEQAMQRDFSWEKSGREYLKVYEKLLL